MPVEIQTLDAKPVDQITEFVSTVKSLQSTTVVPQAEGYLTKVLVKAGDRVTAGMPLFEIDSTSQQALVANLQSVRAARESDLSLAKQRAARAKALLDAGAGPLQDVEAANAAVQSADAQLKSLDEQIKQQKNELGYYKVTVRNQKDDVVALFRGTAYKTKNEHASAKAPTPAEKAEGGEKGDAKTDKAEKPAK